LIKRWRVVHTLLSRVGFEPTSSKNHLYENFRLYYRFLNV
jgi:hypothetical protein